jgi:hypothetical protein
MNIEPVAAEELLQRLPLPLAQLYRRALNARPGLERHQAAYYLWEAALKLLGTITIATYADRGAESAGLTERLRNLARPSLGDWWEFVRLLVPVLAGQGNREYQKLQELVLVRSWDDLPEAACLDKSLREALGGRGRAGATLRLSEFFDRMVRYRTNEIATGALGLRPPAFYEHMGNSLLAGVTEILGRVDVLVGGRLLYADEIRLLESGKQLVQYWELRGERPRRLETLQLAGAPANRLPRVECVHLSTAAGEDAPCRPVSLDPLVLCQLDTNEVLFMIARRAREQAEYGCYTTGRLLTCTVRPQRGLLATTLQMPVDKGLVEAPAETSGPLAESATPPAQVPGPAASAFDDGPVRRLPLPLAQLYRRACNAGTPLARYQAAYYLWEAALKLLGTVAIATYAELGADDARVTQRLRNLARPTLSHWWELVQLLVPQLAKTGGTHFAAINEFLFTQSYDDLPRAAELNADLGGALGAGPGTSRGVRLGDVFARLMEYRSRVLHGAGTEPSGLPERMADPLLAGVSEIIGRLDTLAGGRLLYVTDVCFEASGRWRVERSELTGETGRRIASVDLPESASSHRLLPGRVYVEAPPGGPTAADSSPVPIPAFWSLHPLVVYEPDREEAFFLLARQDRQRIEYLSYSSGRVMKRPAPAGEQRERLARALDDAVDGAAAHQLVPQAGPEGQGAMHPPEPLSPSLPTQPEKHSVHGSGPTAQEFPRAHARPAEEGPGPPAPAFDEGPVGRLPLPLAQLYRRACNARTPLERHQAAYYLWEAALKLLGAVAVATYADLGTPDARLAERLENLTRPALGHWWEFIRQLSPVLAERGEPGFQYVRELFLGRARADLPRTAFLDAALREAAGQSFGTRGTVRVSELVDRLVRYRNQGIVHGMIGQHPAAFYERMAHALLAAGTEFLGDHYGLAGGTLLYIAGMRRLESGNWEVDSYRLTAEAPLRMKPMEVRGGSGAWRPIPHQIYLDRLPGGARPWRPVSLHPLAVYDLAANELFFLRRRTGRHRIEYLCYTNGRAVLREELGGPLPELLLKIFPDRDVEDVVFEPDEEGPPPAAETVQGSRATPVEDPERSARLRYAIENKFPYPVARAFYHLRGLDDWLAEIPQLANLLVAALQHLAIVALADYLAGTERDGDLNKRLSDAFQKPLSHGGWAGLLRDVLTWLKGRPPTPFTAKLVEAYFPAPRQKALDTLKGLSDDLVQLRNDLIKRTEGSLPGRAEQQEFKRRLIIFLQELAFLTDYPIVSARGTQTQGDIKTHHCQLHVGFHETSEMVDVRCDLDLVKGRVVVLNSAGSEVLYLYPFYHVAECREPGCRSVHFFRIDKVDKKGIDYIAGGDIASVTPRPPLTGRSCSRAWPGRCPARPPTSPWATPRRGTSCRRAIGLTGPMKSLSTSAAGAWPTSTR